MFTLFKDWYKEKYNINLSQIELIKNTTPNPLYFTRIDGNILRADKNNGFINLTDISNIYEKDLRNYKKRSDYKAYIAQFPQNCLSSQKIKDDFGTRITLVHSDLALMYIKHLDKTNGETRKEIEKFINLKRPLEEEEEKFEEKYAEIIFEDKEKEPQVEVVNERKECDHNPVQDLNLFNLTEKDFEECRITLDGKFSMYDAISKFKGCSDANSRKILHRIEQKDIVPILEQYQFNRSDGRKGRPTPVATFSKLLNILSVSSLKPKGSSSLPLRNLKNTKYINEQGLYCLIFGSKKPIAKKFRKWVFEEVLPSIRKNGYYLNPNMENKQIQKL